MNAFSPDVQVSLGSQRRARGDGTGAMTAFRAALREMPDRTDALLPLGALLIQNNQPADAERVLRHCCSLAPTCPQARHAWGLALMLCSSFDAAFAELLTAHLLDARNALCGVHLADVAQLLGNSGALFNAVEAERLRDPANSAVLTTRGVTLAHLHDRGAAIETLQAAAILGPRDRVACKLYAEMLARSTRAAEAEVALRHALTLDADNHDAVMALSVVLMRLHRYAEAVALLEGLLAAGAPPLGPLCNLATALAALGRQDQAVERAKAAIAHAPDHPAPRRALCNVLPYAPMVSGAALLAAATECAAVHPLVSLGAIAPVRTERRLRIALVSGTLRAHPVGWLTLAGFEQLDRTGFDLVAFSPNPPEDALGKRFAAITSDWHDISALDDSALAARARALDIDIAIDLGGYGDFGRLPAFGLRLAPVQVKWVGMQNHSTGLAEMDWFMTDRWQTPPEHASLYCEKLLVMPDGYVCYEPPTGAPAPSATPAMSRGHVTFGCFNNLAKLTPRVLQAWARILARVVDAKLLLKAHQFNDADTCASVRDGLAACGVDPERVILRGSSPHAELLRQYSDVDLILDPFPYSGGLTTVEALWMGVPTLTMPGDTFASRHSCGHMSNVGLADWVVADEDAYVAQAISRAGDIPRLAALRAGLRDHVRSSPLVDAPRFGAALGAALRLAWDTPVSDKRRIVKVTL